VTEPLLGHAILAVVALQRGVEWLVARANAGRLVSRGGVAVPRDGVAGLVAVHVAWLAAIAIERAAFGARMAAPWAVPLGVAVALVEALRVWLLATLGRRWTIRVVVMPGETPVHRGPYRFLRHPNYVVLTLELLLIPAWLGAWWTAAGVALPHAATLAYRIRREEAAWREVAATPLP
jgi:methyltransferase